MEKVGKRKVWSLQRSAVEGKKVKDVWPGSNRFYFGGRCIVGPMSDSCAQCCIYTLMISIVGVYFGLFAYKLGRDVSVWLPISFAVVAGFNILLYFLTHCTDPGVIPPREFVLNDIVELRSSLMAHKSTLLEGVIDVALLENRDPKLRNSSTSSSLG
jgi:hypothetical protein